MTFNPTKHAKKFILLSLILLVASILVAVIIGPDMGADARGGAQFTYHYEEGDTLPTEAERTSALQTIGKEYTIQEGESLLNKTKTLTITLADGTQEDLDQLAVLYPDKETPEGAEVLSETLGKQYLLEHQSQRSVYLRFLVAGAIALAILLVYSLLRFRAVGGFAAGITAGLLALHNMLILVGIYTLFGTALDVLGFSFVLATGLLTIAGALVILDNLRNYHRTMDGEELLFTAVNDSAFPLLLTALLGIILLIVAQIFIGHLAYFPMILGIILAVYTTFGLCCPLWAAISSKYTAEQ